MIPFFWSLDALLFLPPGRAGWVCWVGNPKSPDYAAGGTTKSPDAVGCTGLRRPVPAVRPTTFDGVSVAPVVWSESLIIDTTVSFSPYP